MINQEQLLCNLKSNLTDILRESLHWKLGESSLILYDQRTPLAALLAQAYRALLPRAGLIHFDENSPKEILKEIHSLPSGALIVLIQSSSFRLNEFRFRIELFKLGFKVIEHAHLERIQPEEYPAYANGLAYDPNYYKILGPALKERIDRCETVRLICPESELFYRSRFEESKLNIGDYRALKNVGGQFPIGEVFSEPRDLTKVDGELELFAFGDSHFKVCAPPKSFKVRIEKGNIVAAPDAPIEFEKILEEIQKVEKRVWIRELGFGLNRAFTKERRVSDIGTYERMCGVHLSVGAKHGMYTKEGFPKKKCRFHVDVFADVVEVKVDEEVVFRRGEYCIGKERQFSS